MQRNRWRYRSALAALIPVMLFVNIGAQATPPSPLGPHTIVATAQETDCGGWINFPCYEYAAHLIATEGVGGTALLYASHWGLIRVNLTCVSFEESNYGDFEGHIFRASGTTEDGTKYYFVAEDDGQLPYYQYDYLAMTDPGDGACGTFDGARRPWNFWRFYQPSVVITP